MNSCDMPGTVVLPPKSLPTKNVIQLYIRVSVVLTWQLYRTEREKLDIKLDSTVMLGKV